MSDQDESVRAGGRRWLLALLATMGLAKRLYFYGKPGATQKTSLRLNEVMRREITDRGAVIAAHFIGMDFQFGLRVHFRLIGQQQGAA